LIVRANQFLQRRREHWKAGQLIARAIQSQQGRRKPWNAGQLILKTLQLNDSLDERRKYGQSQTAEIEFSVLAAHKSIDCNVHGWLGCHLDVAPYFYANSRFNFYVETSFTLNPSPFI
jgi:hypothetical protein